MLEQLSELFTTIAVIAGGIIVLIFVGCILTTYLDED